MAMPLDPTWQDIAFRLFLTVVAGAVIGLNREARGHAAGFRTTILVGLAAAIAMIQANILLSTAGKAPDSFATMDVLRFPLGVLTGVGFIGGGTILKRGSLVTGVTTAATLWLMTAVGLCIGGGQIGVGVAATLIAVFTLWALKWLDLRIPRDHRASLVIDAPSANTPPDIEGLIRPLGYRVSFLGQRRGASPDRLAVSFEVTWSQRDIAGPPTELITMISRDHVIDSIELIAEGGH